MEGCGEMEREGKETEKMKTVEGEMASRSEDAKIAPPGVDTHSLLAAAISKESLAKYVLKYKEEQARTEKELPYGMRTKLVFDPTDEELILNYLSPKVSSLVSLCVPLIPDCDVFSTEPWNLPVICPGDDIGYHYVTRRSTMYFFQRRFMDPRFVAEELKCCKRPAGNGYWECFREGLRIKKYNNSVVGWKDRYAFKMNDRPSTEETGWVMEAYTLRWEIQEKPTWMICKIYDRSKGRKRVHGGSIDSQSNERSLTREPTTYIAIKDEDMRNGFDPGLTMSFSYGSSGSSDDESMSSESSEESSETDEELSESSEGSPEELE